MTAVMCVGIAVMDLLFTMEDLPTGEGKFYAESYREVGGGVAANAAVAVEMLGGSARYVGRVGDDPLGARILAELELDGVDVSRVQAVGGVASPVSAVFVDASGERTIVNYTPPTLFTGGDLQPAGELADADAVLVDVRWPDGAARALEAAQAAGVPGAFHFDRPLQGGGLELARAASHPAFSQPALAATAASSDPLEGLARMAEATGAWVAVTLGDAGVRWFDEGGAHHLPAFEVEVLDTVGAGDVFHGALALELGEGRDSHDAVRFASAAAALKCTKPGARLGTPGRQEVEEFLEARS